MPKVDITVDPYGILIIIITRQSGGMQQNIVVKTIITIIDTSETTDLRTMLIKVLCLACRFCALADLPSDEIVDVCTALGRVESPTGDRQILVLKQNHKPVCRKYIIERYHRHLKRL